MSFVSTKSALLMGIAAFATLASTGSAQAATVTGNFNVTLTLVADCKLISQSDMAFGSNGVIQTAIVSTSTINVQCTNTTPYNIGLGAGNGTGATTTVRKMTSGAGGTVNYALYSNSARTANWGNTIGTDTVAGTGTGASQALTVYGSVPVQTTPAPGAYSDIVQVTVTF